jgi:ParB family chromosome partitioning protein
MPTQEQIEYLAVSKVSLLKQVREVIDDESQQRLAASIEEHGLLVPIRVRKVGDAYVVVDGERRFRAVCSLGKASIGAIVEAKELDEGGIIQRQIITNIQREDLSPLEKARGIRRLMDVTGWNASQVSPRLGISNASVTRLLSLLSLPAEIQDRIATGEIPVSAAYELSRVEGTQQTKLAEQVANGKMTRDALSGARKASKSRGQDSSALPGRVTAQLGEGRSVTVSCPSLDMEGFIGVLEDVLARARKVRPQGVLLKTFLSMLHDSAEAG